MMNLTTLLDAALPLRAIQQWGWKPAADEFVPNGIVFDKATAEVDSSDTRLLSTPHLVVEIVSDDLAADVLHWFDGGETKLDNLVLLCRSHHRMVHEGRFPSPKP